MRNTYLQMCDYGSRFRILKGGKISLVVSAFIASTTLLHAAPSGGVVTAGNASIAQSGAVTTITQSTQKAAINWNNFSIGTNETVNFNQPNVSSVTLNRVVGNEKSIIDGALNANGQVFILNSNGVLFSKNASINTAGLVATTMNLSDADFMNGNYSFKGESTASVINQGTINISDKGYAALFGKEVKNEGIIKATLGKVELVGAKEVTLNLNGNSLVNLKVDKGVLDALVENKGAIYADGGEVYLTTNAVNELLKGVVNNTGIVEAKTLDDITGKIELFAHGGEAKVGGTIKAEGGFVETSGKEFTIAQNATIKAKEWLIDPVNITIDSTLASTIGTALGSGDVTITTNGSNTPDTSSGESGTNGDITVASAITWASDNDLTLSAYRNIAINANITATGTGGKLSLLYGQGSASGGATDNYTLASGKTINLQDGQNFSTRKGTTVGNMKNYTVISSLGIEGDTSATTLQGVKSNLTGNFALGANIDASATSGWNSGAGFAPIGDGTTAFSGLFDGLGHTVSNLTINRPTTNSIGLFGRTTNTFRGPSNIGVTNATINGKSIVGALGGEVNTGSVYNAWSSGSITGNGNYVGGLIGYSYAVDNSYSTASVSLTGSFNSIGGLVGYHASGSLTNSYATGSVTGSSTSDSVGGLVGAGGTITNSYATGNVSGNTKVGGLVGFGTNSLTDVYATGNVTGIGTNPTGIGGLVGSQTGDINRVYASGNVSGYTEVGGLLGRFSASANDVYALGNVTGTTVVGGLVGYNLMNNIYRGYAVGLVTGSTKTGGLVGNNNAHIYDSFWDIDTTGQTVAIGFNTMDAGNVGIQSTTATINAYSQATYSTFNFTAGTGKWYMVDGKTRPFLQSEYSTTINNTHQLQLIGMNTTTLAATYTQASNIDFVSTAAMKMWNPENYFVPIGNVSADFKGIYDGNNKTISNLQINNNGASRVDYLGLFGQTYSAAVLRNIGIESGTINTTQGSYYLGGLVGMNQGLIENSYSKANLTGNGNDVGGLVGMNMNSTANIRYSYSAGSVHGDWYVGGFAGQNSGNAQISNSYSVGNVVADYWSLGGFIGTNAASVTNSYSTGSVTSTYATASGQASQVGGFVGESAGGTYSGNFWDKETSKATSAGSGAGLVGKTTAQMKTKSTYSDAGWDFADIWGIKTDGSVNNGYPVIKGTYIGTGIVFAIPVTITLTGDLTKTYGDANPAISYTSSNGITLDWGSAMTQWTNAGTYAFSSTANIFAPAYSSGVADDYAITYAYGAYGITVSPYTLALSGFTASNKVYNANTTASVTGTLGAALNGDTVNLTGTFADKNVGTGKTVTAGVSNANYTIAATTATADITAKALTAITGITASNKEYNGLTSATIDFASAGFTGKEGGDTLSISSATGAFDTKNVGTGKTVTISGITLGGADAGNYSITGLTPTTTADITAKAVTLSAPDVTREYNGNTTYTASAGDLSTLSALLGVAGDSISAITLAFNTKDVGTNNKTLTPSAAIINDGNSGNNYAITYADNTTSTISPKALSLSGAVADNKVYDGLTTATMSNYGTITGVIGSEVVTIDTSSATSTFADKNVGTGKTVTISGVTLGGADAGNYTAGSSLTTTADITRLSSVTWVGGATGDWSNPANWTGGAIPDFSNVASVVIPVGKTVSFDAGLSAPVHVDNISSLGGLDVAAGTLNVANLLSTATYNQTGGAVTGHDMTVTTSYAQPAGTITMSGDVTINQAVGGVAIGELASDTLHVTTTNGAITQVGGSKITSTTSSTFVAGGDNDITLTNNDNEFGVLTMSGNDVAVKDKDALPLGNVIATGTVGITTTNGNITQSTGSKIEAGGDTTIVAGNDKDIILNNDNNDFNHIAATGNDISIKDKNDVVLDNIIATGTVTITTTNGNISQSTGSKIEAGGDTTISAGGDKDVTLEEDDNDFNKITVAGNNVSVKDKDGLEVGGLTATGTAKVETTTGNITQTTGSTVSVTGGTTLIAGGTGGGNGTVTLGSTTNTFGAPVNITGSDATIGARTAPTFGTLTGLTAPTVQTPPQTNGNDVQQVIDSIIQSVARPPVISGSNNPSFTSPLGTPAPLMASTATTPAFTNGGVNQSGAPLSFVSQPTDGEANQRITLSELRTLQQPSNQEGQSGTTPIVGDIRIALAQNSLIGLVNGGVRLPEGVDQEFYVVEDRRALRR